MRSRTGSGAHKLHGGLRVAFHGDHGSTLGVVKNKCKTHAFVWNVFCHTVDCPDGQIVAIDMNAITHVVCKQEFEYLQALLRQGREFLLYDREFDQMKMF